MFAPLGEDDSSAWQFHSLQRVELKPRYWCLGRGLVEDHLGQQSTTTTHSIIRAVRKGSAGDGKMRKMNNDRSRRRGSNNPPPEQTIIHHRRCNRTQDLATLRPGKRCEWVVTLLGSRVRGIMTYLPPQVSLAQRDKESDRVV
jgi:hypothetical protein